MDRTASTEADDQPLVELAPEEAVLAALIQSAHPVEFVEANPPAETPAKPAS